MNSKLKILNFYLSGKTIESSINNNMMINKRKKCNYVYE